MRIRQYTKDDYPAVRDLWERTGLLLSLSDEREELHRMLDYHPELFLVGELPNQIIGSVIGSFDGRRAYVHHLAVDPDYQGRGYGTRLMEHLEEKLEVMNVVKYHLLIEQCNADVAGFYRKLGWYERDDLVMMSKNLRTDDRSSC
ncbi:MAG: Acetyltransferase YpeA [Candidatus Marinimicrobia bacterium]|nr:Acetyltransferase YpeA [Candidatus Neomarinimicrobiota bacterium]